MDNMAAVDNVLENFQYEKTLGVCPYTKKIFVKGNFTNKEGIAIVILSKESFSDNDLPEIFKEHLKPKVLFQNDIYLSFKHFPMPELVALKATLIHPADEILVKKYTIEPNHLVYETPELYEKIAEPYHAQHPKSLEWVFNILEHKSESERIIYEDPDPHTGFVLIPDLKWDGVNLEGFYLQAIIHKKGIKSLRDLRGEHLPLLKNIANVGLTKINEKYSIDKSKILVYLHYYPSFFHLHVHFNLIGYGNRGLGAERCHLLNTVIQNLELSSEYYKRATLPVSLRQSEELLQLFNGKLTNGVPTPVTSV